MERNQNLQAVIMTIALFTLSLLAARTAVPNVLPQTSWLHFGLIALAVFLLTEGLFIRLTLRRRKEA